MNIFATFFLLAMIALSSCHWNPITTGLEDIGPYIQRRPDSALVADVWHNARDFNKVGSLYQHDKTILRRRYILVILFLIIVLSVIIFSFLRKRRLIYQENEKMLDAIKLELEDKYSLIEKENAALKKKVAELQKKYVNLYQKQFLEVGKYYDASFNCNPDRASQKIIRHVAAEINIVLSEISVQHRNRSKFESRINSDADNIIAKIRKDYPRYSEDNIRFICYVVAGFDATTISVLMKMTGESVRVRKHRIRMRLLRDAGENAELYGLWFA